MLAPDISEAIHALSPLMGIRALMIVSKSCHTESAVRPVVAPFALSQFRSRARIEPYLETAHAAI